MRNLLPNLNREFKLIVWIKRIKSFNHINQHGDMNYFSINERQVVKRILIQKMYVHNKANKTESSEKREKTFRSIFNDWDNNVWYATKKQQVELVVIRRFLNEVSQYKRVNRIRMTLYVLCSFRTSVIMALHNFPNNKL